MNLTNDYQSVDRFGAPTLLMCRRIAVASGVLVFIAWYLLLAVHVGIVVTIAIGWIICGALAWLFAIAVLHICKFLFRV